MIPNARNWLLPCVNYITAFFASNTPTHTFIRPWLNRTDHPGELACSALKLQLGGIVTTLGAEYDKAAYGAWNYFNALQHPSCVVFPTTSADVSLAMKAIFEYEANYAVQAGGHSAMKDWNNVDDGVLIHFANMKNVSYNADRDSIILEPGIHWGEAIQALEPFGVAPSGGRVATVGTGLLLGGGLSFLSPSVGFSVDTLREVDVVLTTGQLVTASASGEYSDLFRALKGGGNRFGIVTRYEMDANHVGRSTDRDWFGGTIYFPNSSAELVLNATADFVERGQDPNASLLVAFVNVNVFGYFSSFSAAWIFYRGPKLPTNLFGDFLNIPYSSRDLKPLSYYEVAHTVQEPDIHGGRLFGATALAGQRRLHLDAFNRFTNFSTTFVDSYYTTVLAFTPVLNHQILAGRKRGGNAIDPPLGGYNAVDFAVTLSKGVTETPREVEDGRQLWFEQTPPSFGLPLYLGESDIKQNSFETYGQYDFLKQTYAKYDPSRFNVRHMAGPIGL